MNAITIAPYTMRAVEELLGLRRQAIVGLISAGFVAPSRGPRNEFRFTFQDVVILRTAHRLQEAHVPFRRILVSLRTLRERLPEEIPLSGLRITAIGGDIAVRSPDAQWEAPSGQFLLDFEVTDKAEHLQVISRLPVVEGPDEAEAHFRRGHRLEATDPGRAEDAYRQALGVDTMHAPSLLNLGALLCRQGHCDDAAELYEAALAAIPDHPGLHFNLGIALEDQRRYASAIAAYERALELDPELADAHYNVALLHERLGNARQALRHLSAYRRLTG